MVRGSTTATSRYAGIVRSGSTKTNPGPTVPAREEPRLKRSYKFPVTALQISVFNKKATCFKEAVLTHSLPVTAVASLESLLSQHN
jgi:hypothetical protein